MFSEFGSDTNPQTSFVIVTDQIQSNQDYVDVSARNTTRAPNSMQLEIKSEKSKMLKRLSREKC